jgi:hypothetical protein
MTEMEIKAWREQYHVMSEDLEKVRFKEVNALTEESARYQIRSLQVPGIPWRFRPNWSGLIDQQAIFHDLRRE